MREWSAFNSSQHMRVTIARLGFVLAIMTVGQIIVSECPSPLPSALNDFEMGAAASTITQPR